MAPCLKSLSHKTGFAPLPEEEFSPPAWLSFRPLQNGHNPPRPQGSIGIVDVKARLEKRRLPRRSARSQSFPWLCHVTLFPLRLGAFPPGKPQRAADALVSSAWGGSPARRPGQVGDTHSSPRPPLGAQPRRAQAAEAESRGASGGSARSRRRWGESGEVSRGEGEGAGGSRPGGGRGTAPTTRLHCPQLPSGRSFAPR